MSAQIAADLRAAADVLERDGWTQGSFHRLVDEGRICHCAEGAIAVASGRHEDVRPDPVSNSMVDWKPNTDASARHWDALDALAEVIDAHNIPSWNDTPGRTADEVIAALRAAADAVEATA